MYPCHVLHRWRKPVGDSRQSKDVMYWFHSMCCTSTASSPRPSMLLKVITAQLVVSYRDRIRSNSMNLSQTDSIYIASMNRHISS